MAKLTKNEGVTESERYLDALCERAFLSLWSHPGLYKQPGKELCDLLVVFGDDIIIFSDKHCKFPTSGDPLLNWSRWYRRAILKAAEQAWGAERWIRKFPDRVFEDRECKVKFPLSFPDMKQARFHIVVVSHGASKVSKDIFGGSGSFMLRSELTGMDVPPEPFVINDIDPKKTFVHVLDDTSLDIVLKTLDTVSDFVRYLSKKENYFRKWSVLATGEEDLLGTYLARVNSNDEHDFFIPPEPNAHIAIGEHTWREFKSSPQYKAKLEVDQISYFWDDLIDGFHKRGDTKETFPYMYGGLEGLEVSTRIMAKEDRFHRRRLAMSFLEALAFSPPEAIFNRIMMSESGDHPHYAFVFFPMRKDVSYEDNREVRMGYLLAVCMVVKLRFPEAKDIIGISTESGADYEGRSIDTIYFDARNWTEEDAKEAGEAQRKYNILINPKMTKTYQDEFPMPASFSARMLARLKNVFRIK